MSLVVNKIAVDWVDKERLSLICMKNQQKIKVLLNGTDVINVEQWTMLSACVATKLKPWNTLNY